MPAVVDQLISVRQALPTDLTFIDSLQKVFRNEVAFLPRMALESYIARQSVTIGFLNGDPACYLLGRYNTTRFPNAAGIYQAAVRYDARHRLLGSTLVETFIDNRTPGCNTCHLWCAQDIEANLFWESVGFESVAWRYGSDRRGRIHIFWRRPLTDSARAMMHVFPSQTQPGLVRKVEPLYPFLAGETWQTFRAVRPRVEVDGNLIQGPFRIARSGHPAPDPPAFRFVVAGGRLVRQPKLP